MEQPEDKELVDAENGITAEEEIEEKMPLVAPLECIREMFAQAWQRERAARLKKELPNWQDWIAEKRWTLANSSEDPSFFITNIRVKPAVRAETENSGDKSFSLVHDAVGAVSDFLKIVERAGLSAPAPVFLRMPVGSQIIRLAAAEKLFEEKIKECRDHKRQYFRLSVDDIDKEMSAIAHKGFRSTGVLPIAVELMPGDYFLGFKMPVEENGVDFVGELQKFDLIKSPAVKSYLKEHHGLTEHILFPELSASLHLQAEALSTRLKTPFDLPEVKVSPEVIAHWPKIKEVLDETFGTDNLEAILSPRADQLTDAYFEVMYPPTQTKEDKKNGLFSYRPDWWNKPVALKDANNQLLFPGETFGQVYIRAIRSQAKQLEGKIILAESLQKPKYRGGQQKYGTVDGTDDTKDKPLTILRTILNDPKMVRFSHTGTKLTDTITAKLKEYIDQQLTLKGVPKSVFPHLDFLLTPHHLFNLQTTLLHPENSSTNCYEWSSTVLEKKDGTATDRIMLSGDFDYGGASYARDGGPADSYASRGFRLSVVLS